jgi:S-sulfosulfanyl-L-cysteine sulfohydrolase
MNRREFLEVLGLASIAGLDLGRKGPAAAGQESDLYDVPRFGNVSLLHFTDSHAQLLPLYHREPYLSSAVAQGRGLPPYLDARQLLDYYGIGPGSAQAYALTHLDFVEAAHRYGKVGGFAHLATLVKKLRAERQGALLLDGGDTWQGSATTLWTQGQDMVDACKLLGVDAMTGHWEFTLGAERLLQIVQDLRGKIDFLAQNVATKDFGDPVFESYVLREINGTLVAVIGQAYPYTPIANPPHMIPDWTFGIQEESVQRRVDEVLAKGASVVVLLSHNGLGIDLQLASRVTGIDVILGGHTHDPLPRPMIVENRTGKTLVTNAGSNGKFLAVLDLRVDDGHVLDYRYHLLPVLANMLPADPDMQALIDSHRSPFSEKLRTPLANNETLLYRRDTFSSTFDKLILQAMLREMEAEIALSPGFRWGTTLLPGVAITWEDLLAQTAITYPQTETREMSGIELKGFLEDKADNVFNPDPYYQQGGDMTRVAGLRFSLNPDMPVGQRVSAMKIGDRAIDPAKRYKVASWAPLEENPTGKPIWDLVASYLSDLGVVSSPALPEDGTKVVLGTTSTISAVR